MNITSPSRARGRLAAVSLSTCLLVAMQSARAADLYWDINGATANTGSTATGAWNGTNAFWNSDATGDAGGSVTATTTASDVLHFSSGTNATGTSTVTVSGTQVADSLTFEEGTVTLGGTGTIAFGSGTSGINVDSGLTATISAFLTGTNGFSKTGTGNLVLGNTANSGLTGTIAVKSGALASGSNTTNATNGQLISLGDTTGSASATFSVNRNQNYNSAVVVNSGSSGVKRISGGPGLSANQTPTITAAITLNDNVTLGNGAGGVYTGNNYGGLRLSGAITGSKTITVDGTNAFVDPQTYTTNIANATLAATMANISGNNSATFTGNVAVERGVFIVGNAGAVGTNTAIVSTSAGSAFNLPNTSIGIAGLNNGTTTGGSIVNLGTSLTSTAGTSTLSLKGGGNYSYGGTIVDGTYTGSNAWKMALTVDLAGTGSQILSGVNTYTGNTTVTKGTLLVNGSLGATATTVATTGTLGGIGTLNNGATVNGTLAAGNSGTGALTFGAALTVNGTYAWEINANSTVSGFDAINITAGNVTFGGSSVFDISVLGGVDFSNPFWASNQSWAVINNSGSGSISGAFLSLTGTTSNAYGSFGLDYGLGGAGDDLLLKWTATAIPEPSSCAVIAGAGALGAVGLLRRRRR